MAVILIVKDGEDIHNVRLTAKPTTLGRSSRCDFTLDDGMVSGKHMAVKLSKDGRAIMKDLGTTNGTYVNGSQILESHLYLDDIIQVGQVQMQLDKEQMNPREVKLHERDYERTSVTFVQLKRNPGEGVASQAVKKIQEQEAPSTLVTEAMPTNVKEKIKASVDAEAKAAKKIDDFLDDDDFLEDQGHELTLTKTETMAIDKEDMATATKKAASKKKKAKKKVKKKEVKQEADSIKDKLFGFFKK